MNTCHITLQVVVIIGSLSTCIQDTVNAQPPDRTVGTLQPPARSALKSVNAYSLDSDFGADCEAVFSLALPADLILMEQSEDRNIQIFSRWEQLRRRRTPEVARAEQVRETCRFVGFIEGRLQLRMPDWWVAALMPAESRLNWWALPNKKVLSRYGWVQSAGQYNHAPDLTVVEEGAILRCRLRNLVCDVNKSVIGQLPGVKTLAISAAGGKCFAVAPSGWPLSYKLMCFDERSKVDFWNQDVWCGAWAGASGMPGIHFTALQCAEGHVFVVGATIDTVYLEGFHIATGVPVLRFSTAYY